MNDTYGHKTGDTLLATVASSLKSHLREADTIARLGGDEFAALLPETDGDAALAALGNLKESLQSEMKYKGWPVDLSIGIASFQLPPERIEEIISAADEAMYAAKRLGLGRPVIRKVRDSNRYGTRDSSDNTLDRSAFLMGISCLWRCGYRAQFDSAIMHCEERRLRSRSLNGHSIGEMTLLTNYAAFFSLMHLWQPHLNPG